MRCLATLCAWSIGSATAMTFISSPPTLYLGGAVVASDWDAWQETMQRFGPQIDTVVLHDSGGGDSAAGRRIGADIRQRKLRTVVHGRCSSACANMFLGGTERQFALTDKTITAVLGYHGSYNKKTAIRTLLAFTLGTIALATLPAHAGKTIDGIKARGQLTCGVNTGLGG